MSDQRKKLGRDPFRDAEPKGGSETVGRLIKGRPATRPAREVEISVKLTPAALKHLDRIREQLAARGRANISRDELIRIAITLLSADDIT